MDRQCVAKTLYSIYTTSVLCSALRFCRQHEEQLKADACAKSLHLGEGGSFWQNVKRMSNGKATKYANCVADVTGDNNIAEMWKDHFAGLYNSVADSGFKGKFLEQVATTKSSD